jgi:hypothetical protein
MNKRYKKKKSNSISIPEKQIRQYIEHDKKASSFEKAINEFKNGETVSFEEYLKQRKIDV